MLFVIICCLVGLKVVTRARIFSSWYLIENKDVQLAGINPLIHFLKYGVAEGRAMQSSEVVEEDLVLIRSSALFDESWYLAHHPDIAEGKIMQLTIICCLVDSKD